VEVPKLNEAVYSLNRLPKKLQHSIYQNPNPPQIGWQAHGWAVHIIEGPNGKAMLALTAVVVIVTFGFALIWASVRKDVQGAYGIASYVVACASSMIFGFYVYYPAQRFQKA
jgi:hypothetical protein